MTPTRHYQIGQIVQYVAFYGYSDSANFETEVMRGAVIQYGVVTHIHSQRITVSGSVPHVDFVRPLAPDNLVLKFWSSTIAGAEINAEMFK